MKTVNALKMESARQHLLLAVLIVLDAVAVLAYVLMPGGMRSLTTDNGLPTPTMDIWQLALGNAAIVLLGYGAFGLIGLWLAQKAGLPGVVRAGADWMSILWRPMMLGTAVGVVLVIADLAAQASGGYAGFPHPPFPASLLASFTAGIGEEVMFRLLLMSLWAVLLGWAMQRALPGHETRTWSLWLANGIAALAFGASHLPTAMALQAVTTPMQLPPLMLAELVLLNGILGIISGRMFIRDGLVAASGVHFSADVVWHVIFGGLT